MTDEPVVARVIENLISNAVVYMHGDFSITLEEKGSKVILTISNDTQNLVTEDVKNFIQWTKTVQTKALDSA